MTLRGLSRSSVKGRKRDLARVVRIGGGCRRDDKCAIEGDTDATIPLAHALHLKEKTDRIGANVEMAIVKNVDHNWRKAGGDPAPGVGEIQRITAEYALRQVEPMGKRG